MRLRFCACAVLIALVTGCGSGGIAPNRDGSLPLLTSPEIAAGAWTILGAPTIQSNQYNNPVAGFYGAFTAQDTTVAGYLNIASDDGSHTGQISPCLTTPLGGFGVGLSTVFVRGTASAGHLVLDGSFAANRLHLDAQLSADRRSLVSGSYQVTGPCQTIAPQISGFASPPVTGHFAGLANSHTGATYKVSADLAQGTTINGFGQIPVDGAFTFTGGCTSTLTLRGGSVDGSLGDFFAFSAATPYNDAGVFSEQDPTSDTLLLDEWGYSNPTCGSDYSAAANPGQLTRQ